MNCIDVRCDAAAPTAASEIFRCNVNAVA